VVEFESTDKALCESGLEEMGDGPMTSMRAFPGMNDRREDTWIVRRRERCGMGCDVMGWGE